MDIQIGSKCVRVAMDTPSTNERFIGQEVEVVPPPRDWGQHRVWIKRKYKDGTLSSPPLHLSKESFIEEFEPFVINLENK